MNVSYSPTDNVRRFPDEPAVVHGDTRELQDGMR